MHLWEKALAFKEIEKRLKAHKKPVDDEVRADFEAKFDPSDRKSVWRTIDGKQVKLGTLSLSDPTPVREVTDLKAYDAWVAKHFPAVPQTRVVEVTEIPSSWTAQVLKDGHVIHPETGEMMIPDGVTEVTRKPAFTVAPEPDILESLTGAEITDLLELETGG